MEMKDEFLDVIKEMIKEREEEGHIWAGKEYKRRSKISNANPDSHIPFEVNKYTEGHIAIAEDPQTSIAVFRKTSGRIEFVMMSNPKEGTKFLTFHPEQFQHITVKVAEYKESLLEKILRFFRIRSRYILS